MGRELNSRGSERAEIIAIFCDQEEIGQSITSSKKKYTWILEINNCAAVIEFYNSRISGKKKVLWNNRVIHESLHLRSTTFSVAWVHGNHAFNIAARIFDDSHCHELFIDGYPFSYYQQQRQSPQRVEGPKRSEPESGDKMMDLLDLSEEPGVSERSKQPCNEDGQASKELSEWRNRGVRDSPFHKMERGTEGVKDSEEASTKNPFFEPDNKSKSGLEAALSKEQLLDVAKKFISKDSLGDFVSALQKFSFSDEASAKAPATEMNKSSCPQSRPLSPSESSKANFEVKKTVEWPAYEPQLDFSKQFVRDEFGASNMNAIGAKETPREPYLTPSGSLKSPECWQGGISSPAVGNDEFVWNVEPKGKVSQSRTPAARRSTAAKAESAVSSISSGYGSWDETELDSSDASVHNRLRL